MYACSDLYDLTSRRIDAAQEMTELSFQPDDLMDIFNVAVPWWLARKANGNIGCMDLVRRESSSLLTNRSAIPSNFVIYAESKYQGRDTYLAAKQAAAKMDEDWKP
jgi:hypothetical protein